VVGLARFVPNQTREGNRQRHRSAEEFENRWSAFLRERGIPRPTADRHVKKWEGSLAPLPEKRLSEAISVPTFKQITQTVSKLKPKLAICCRSEGSLSYLDFRSERKSV
jgi:hypothetical protein